MVIYEIRFVYYEFQHIFVVCITKFKCEISGVCDVFPQAQDLDTTQLETAPAPFPVHRDANVS